MIHQVVSFMFLTIFQIENLVLILRVVQSTIYLTFDLIDYDIFENS